MDTLIIMASLMTTTLMLLSTSQPARATVKLIVSNELKTRGNVPVFVTCHPTPELSKSIPLGQKTLIEIPATATAIATTNDDENTTVSRAVQPVTSCVGTFYAEARFERDERPYVLYNSDKYGKDSYCFVLVNDDGFSRWNNGKKTWDKIFPINWF